MNSSGRDNGAAAIPGSATWQWQQLERFRVPLISYLRRRGATTEDAEDLVSDTLLRLAPVATTDPGTLRPLAFTIAKRLHANERRRRGREVHAISRQPGPATLSSHDSAVCGAIVARDTVRRVAARVSGTELRVIVLFAAGYNHPMIATKLGMTARASQVALSRARRKLRSEHQALRGVLAAAQGHGDDMAICPNRND